MSIAFAIGLLALGLMDAISRAHERKNAPLRTQFNTINELRQR